MKIGYARVSTDAQETHLQMDALKRAKCHRIYEEKASGAKAERPELMRLLDNARKGDVIIVWKLDRLGRSLPHLLTTVTALKERGIAFRSLTEQKDTTTPQAVTNSGIAQRRLPCQAFGLRNAPSAMLWNISIAE